MNQEWIMETFAENGCYLDELIESEYDDVRSRHQKSSDFCIKQLNQGKIYQFVLTTTFKNEAKQTLPFRSLYWNPQNQTLTILE